MLVVLTVFTACTQPVPTLTPTPTSTSSPGPTPTAAPANWWDKFGEPQYGGTMTIAEAQVGTNWDVLTFGGGGYFYESLHDQFFAATDPAEAQRLAKEIDQRVIEQHWLVTAGEYYHFNVWQPYLKGYSGELLFQNVNLTLARFWIDHDLKESMGR